MTHQWADISQGGSWMGHLPPRLARLWVIPTCKVKKVARQECIRRQGLGPGQWRELEQGLGPGPRAG